MTALEFGKRVRRLREQAGLSQLEMSLRCDLAPSYIGFIELAKKVPTLTTMNKLAQGLGLTLQELVGDEEPKPALEPSLGQLVAYGTTLTPDEREDMIELMKLVIRRFSRR